MAQQTPHFILKEAMSDPNKILLIAILFLIGCTPSKEKTQSLSVEKMDSVLINWKLDTLGCLGLRYADQESLKQVVKQLELRGESSSVLISYLGEPNYIDYQEDSWKALIYFMECPPDGSTSMSNMYCHFNSDTLYNCSNPVF
ncbi:MAG: hypothetical protein R8G66_06480 [Cytophagales bacterium]|nr:hypothetical protein [Cytophagales bacterium]